MIRSIVGLLLVVTVISATSEPSRGIDRSAVAGGTMKVGVLDSFSFTGRFDPTSEYLSNAWDIYSSLLLRTLVTYRHVAGARGTTLVPDLATEVPDPTDDGLTYTFHIKQGVMFGPPVSRSITSSDIEYAFERIACSSCIAQYGFYYIGTIAGMKRRGGRDQFQPISGIETPDDSTIVFHLTRPTGDFLFRLTLPATAPIPEEIASCFDNNEYGRHIVSSGPYMVDGSQDLDIQHGCSDMHRLTGFDPERSLTLVRNPDYDPSTDTAEVRENLPDEFRFLVRSSTRGIFDQIESGRLDGAAVAPTEGVVSRYREDPALRERLHVNQDDRTWFITMNLTQRPFDDIHVRRAVNWVLNKRALQKAWGGPMFGHIATHIEPPLITGGHPTARAFDPYRTSGHTGSVYQAHREMRRSKYDTDRDGRCDIRACRTIVLINRKIQPWRDMEPSIAASLAKIGIRPLIRDKSSTAGYTDIQTIDRNIPISSVPGWGKDYPDGFTFEAQDFSSPQNTPFSRGVLCSGNLDYPLVGATRRVKKACRAKGNFANLPTVDGAIARCERLTIERRRCWVDLDKRLMRHIVPWVPYLWQNAVRIVSSNVTQYEFDQFSGEMSYAHIAVEG